MATRKPKVTDDNAVIKALKPTDIDIKYMGDEPLFVEQPDERDRAVTIMRSLTWYGRFYGKKDGRDLMAQYLDVKGRQADAKIIRKVADSEFMLPSYCWLGRMVLRGFKLTETEQAALDSEINRLLDTIHKPTVKFSNLSSVKLTAEQKKSIDDSGPTRQNIQDIMREKASEAAGELEGLFDEFIIEGSKAGHKLRPIDEVAKKNVMPQHISILTEVWQKKLNEFEAVVAGKDAQLTEAYSHLTKIQIRNIVKFIELVLSDLNSYISVKKSAKAPRARKTVPVEKIVAKLQYLKVFKEVSTKLDLVSLHPTKIHGASEAWVYDTAKRKLHHYIADEYSKTFTVKGNTLLGFDTATSEVKTLRKPSEQLKEVMGSKPVARKYFKEIKSVATIPNGRFNAAMIILKAF